MDFFNIMGKVSEAKNRIEAAKAKIDAASYTETADGISVTVSGKRQITQLSIDPSAAGDAQLTQNLTNTINAALKKAEAAYKAEIKQSTEGLLPNIPGFDLGSLL